MSSRRNFLKSAIKGVAAGGALLTVGAAPARETHARPAEAMGLLYDATLCIGCKACMAACKEANGNPPEFSTADRLWDTPLDTSGHTFNIIKMYADGAMATKDAEKDGYAFMKFSCMHCADPSCVSACPVSAMTKNPVNGIVEHHPERCIGCRYCVAACPFGIPKYQYDSPTGRIGKCELCRHRHKDGRYSACAEVCPTGATLYGRTEDLLAEAKRRLALKPGSTTTYPRGRLRHGQARILQSGEDGQGKRKRKGWKDEPAQNAQNYGGEVGTYVQHVYGEKEYGGTQVLKLSGVPFAKVGMPDLPPESSAAASETIQHTLYGGLLMPFAVLGALTWAAHRNVENVKKDEGEGGP